MGSKELLMVTKTSPFLCVNLVHSVVIHYKKILFPLCKTLCPLWLNLKIIYLSIRGKG